VLLRKLGRKQRRRAAVQFESANKSIVRAIRQSELLNAWLRIFRRHRAMPLVHQYEADRLDDEKPDLMQYEVCRADGAVRLRITHSGQNVVRAFGSRNANGEFLDEIVDPGRLKFITLALQASIDMRRPIYTMASVFDVDGVPVTYERLVLPFGANDTVQHLLVSLKTISIEGRFTVQNLLRPDAHGPTHLVSAVIDRELERNPATVAVSNDVFEV
jgi:hypothetical protein